MVTIEDVISFISSVPYLNQIIQVAVIALAAVILERLVKKYLRKFAISRDLPPDVGNGLVLISRFAILLGAVALLLRVGGIPADWLTAFGAFGGTAVGFASTRTLGNFVAGLYVLISKPFRVGDYIKVGNYEGVVEEITINYTKIRMPSLSTVSITNQSILDKDIINYRLPKKDVDLNIFEKEEEVYRYNFTVEFDHTLPLDVLEDVLREVIEKHTTDAVKPEYKLIQLSRLSKTFMIYLYTKDPNNIYDKRTVLLKEITEAWENRKKAESK